MRIKEMVIVSLIGLSLMIEAASGAVLTALKTQWEHPPTNQQISVIRDRYGSIGMLNVCTANQWVVSGIIANIGTNKISDTLAGSLMMAATEDERMSLFTSIARNVSKYKAIAILLHRTAGMKKAPTQEALDIVLNINDGSETNFPVNSTYTPVNTRNFYCITKTITDRSWFAVNDMTIKDHVSFLLLGGKFKSTADTTASKEAIKLLSVPLVKKALRDEGKSFITIVSTNSSGQKITINPIETKMAPIVSALNAPKLQGLELALRTIGYEISDIERADAIWDEVIAEKNSIYYGEKAAHPLYDGGIILLLGPEGYNLWVKSYNEGN